MNLFKKLTALVLAFAMVASGIYFVETETGSKEVQAAERTEVSTDMLNVKVQIATDDSNYMRFITSVDSLDYQSVGFELTPEGGTKKTYTTQTVYERIASSDQNIAYTFSPKVVDPSSEYFVTAKLRAKADVNYTVRAFVVTLDGETVYGQSRCVAVCDGQANTPLNLSFESNTTVLAGEEVSVTYGAENTATTAIVIAVDGNTVHVRVDVEKETLPSATKFTFGTAGSTIYRNLYTKYTGAETYDRSWYDVYLADNSSEKEFVIATDADMYGLAQIVNSGVNMNGKVAFLVSDIALNADGSTAYNWTPVGSLSHKFDGTFDGQMHEISNLYVKSNSQGIGLFGATETNAVIQKLSLTDSTIVSECTTSPAYVGGIAGSFCGDMNNVYSNANVSSVKNEVGGLIGRLDGDTVHTITECWFDGTVSVSGGIDIGGIVGRAFLGQTVMKDCLNSGTVASTFVPSDSISYAGGLIGRIHSDKDTTYNVNVYMDDCLNTGAVSASKDAGLGSVIGRARRTLTLGEVYTTNNVSCASGTVATNSTVVGVGNFSTNGNVVYGACTIKTNDSLLGAQGRYNTGLKFYLGEDHDGVWVAREGKTPVLKNFANEAEWYIADETIVADTSWYVEGKDAYLITTAAQMVGLSEKSQTVSFAGVTFTLGADIAFNSGNAKEWATTPPKNVWTPIGYGKTFAGAFYGEGHTISGMYIHTANNYVGLFGRMEVTAEISDFSLTNSYVYTTHAYSQAGSVVGQPAGKVSKIYSDGIVVGTGSYVGGFSGRSISDTEISECWYDGSLTSSGKPAGGFLASISGKTVTFKDCLFTGEINDAFNTAYPHHGCFIGEVVANASFVMERCLSDGSVKVTGTPLKDNSTLGAMIGYMHPNSSGKASNSYYTTECFTVGLNSNTQGVIIGTTTKLDDKVFTKTQRTQISGETAKSTLSSFDFTDTWATVKADAPVPKALEHCVKEVPSIGKIVADKSWYTANPDATEFVIDTAAELMGLAEVVKKDNLSGHTVKLGADIVFNEGDARAWRVTKPINRFDPIGKSTQFWGTFDGQGHSISGLYVNEATAIAGLFGNMSGTVQNLRLENSYIYCSLNAADTMVGSVAGFCTGNMTNVYSNAVVESANEEVGGLVGRFGATYTKTISKCWFDGIVFGHNLYAGGIVGQVNMGNKTISDCLFTGTVNNDWAGTNYPHTGGIAGGVYYSKPNDNTVATTLNLKNCLSIGTMKVKGTSTVGAVIGRFANGSGTAVTYGTIENVYFTASTYSLAISTNSQGDITGTTTNIGETHFNKVEKSAIAGTSATTALTGFDFTNTWSTMTDGTPVLKYFAQ